MVARLLLAFVIALCGAMPAMAQEGEVEVVELSEADSSHSNTVFPNQKVDDTGTATIVEVQADAYADPQGEEGEGPNDEAHVQSTDPVVPQDDVAILQTQATSSRGPSSAGALRMSGNRLVDKCVCWEMRESWWAGRTPGSLGLPQARSPCASRPPQSTP